MMAGVRAIIFAAIVAVSATPAITQAAPAGEYERAQTLFHEKHYREAIAVLDAFLILHPRDARALVLRGDCRADLGENNAALADYNAAIGIAPAFQYAYTTRCETRLALDDTSGALADCNEAIRLDGSDGLAFEDRADVHFARSAYPLALADYDRAIQLGRSSAYVFAARCDAERLTGKPEAAARDCAQALTLDPKSRRGLWARGRLALTQQRYVDAIADLNAYIMQNPPKSDTGYYYRALAFNRLGKYADALGDANTYVARQPRDADGLQERGVARFGTGDAAGALADLQAAAAGYRKDGDLAAAERVDAMLAQARAGRQPQPQP